MDTTTLKAEILTLLARATVPPEHRTITGATEEQLARFEAETGMTLPPELREWLRMCNGSYAGQGGINGVGVVDFLCIDSNYQWHPEWKENGWFPIAGDGCGDEYILAGKLGGGASHPVFFIDHESDMVEPDYLVASDLWHFLYFLLRDDEEYRQTEESHWPFDQEFMLVNDPDILRYQGVISLPWET